MKKELIDTHCHLYLEEFAPDLRETVLRAEHEGVTRIYMPAIDSRYTNAMLEIEKSYPALCRSMAGVHPCYVNENYRQELDHVGALLRERRFAAVGEIGLDYYWDRTFEEDQQIAFREQIALAREYDLPVVIHSRNAIDECIDIIRSEKQRGVRGIFHCFTGSYEQATTIIDCGMSLGIGGVITYKNAGLAELAVRLPLENIVLETDAPYLSPAPFRGKRNESSYLTYILQKLAGVRGQREEDIAAVTSENARAIFGD